MIRYCFGQDDLLRTRFAISPLFEATASIAALRDPAGHSVHVPWVRAARERLAADPALDLRALDALVAAGRGYTPDLISPPRSPLTGSGRWRRSGITSAPCSRAISPTVPAR